MPIYEFSCAKCKNQFECLVLGSDKQVTCPDCNGKKVKRLMSSCNHKSSGQVSSAGSSSGCSSCSGGSCSSCH